jgi:hypothetical protein
MVRGTCALAAAAGLAGACASCGPDCAIADRSVIAVPGGGTFVDPLSAAHTGTVIDTIDRTSSLHTAFFI